MGILYKKKERFQKLLIRTYDYLSTETLIFAQNDNILTIVNEIQKHKDKEFGYNWIFIIRFLLHAGAYCYCFSFWRCFQLYAHRYKRQT